MSLHLYNEPYKNIEYLFTDTGTVDWKGNIGVGDVLFGLNAVHMLTHLARKRFDVPYTTMNFHWVHGKDHLHHYEDPETIIERCDYLHNFYYDKDAVRVKHIFHSKDKDIQTLRHRGFQRRSGPLDTLDGVPSWIFRPDIWINKPVDNRVVFWRPTWNAEKPWGWKLKFTNEHWEKIIRTLEGKGYEMVELSYRTPVREAMYHIRHCRFCIFYDGMWQYIARNLCKPVIALGDSGIIRVHNPQGVHFYRPDDKKNDLFAYIDKIPNVLEHVDGRAKKYENFILNELGLENENRQSSN